MWDKTSGFARYLQHMTTPSPTICICKYRPQLSTSLLHQKVSMKETLQLLYLKLNRDIQCQNYKSKTSFNFFPFAFPENVSQKWRGRGTDLLPASERRGASEFSPNWGKTFEKFSRQWTIPGAVCRQQNPESNYSHTEKLFLNNFLAFWSREHIFRNMASTEDDIRSSRECCSCSYSSS